MNWSNIDLKTRDRIVQEARRLYNQRGYANVSSATLAQHLGITEGNQWYHFKTKRAILTAVSEDFVEIIETRLALLPREGADIVDEYIHLLSILLWEFDEYRFLYRDQSDFGGHDEIIQKNVGGWMKQTQKQLQIYLAKFVAEGLLDLQEDRLPDLTMNATIILRYGLDHYREMGEPIAQGGGAARRTLLRHLTLFEHRLLAETSIRLRRSIDHISYRDVQADKRLFAVNEH